MSDIENLSLPNKHAIPRWLKRLFEGGLAIAGSLAVTAIIYEWQLYPRIPNISILYLFPVILLASLSGRLAAIIASITAFLAFDFFLVPPLYMFTINRWEEWVALFVFLAASLFISHLTALMRQRTDQAQQRERETRTLYELMRITNSLEQLDDQLKIVVLSCLRVFSSWGVQSCTVLVTDPEKILTLRVFASLRSETESLSTDEKTLAVAALHQRRTTEKRYMTQPEEDDRTNGIRLYRTFSSISLTRCIPLEVNDRVLGVLVLRIEHPVSWFASIRRMDEELAAPQSRLTFFQAFLEQVKTLLENAHLRSEAGH